MSFVPVILKEVVRPRPFRNILRQYIARSFRSDTNAGKNKNFTFKVDVKKYSPKEITVKTIDNHIVIEGKHEEKLDEHGFISRHFVRRYVLPKNVQIEGVSSTLSSDGILTITAPKVADEKESKERIIPIIETGKGNEKESTSIAD